MPQRLVPSALLAAAFAAPAPAAEPTTGFIPHTYKNPDGHDSPYVVWVPPTYDGKTPAPLVLFLHGSGETKGGKKEPKDVGIGAHLPHRRDVPMTAVVVIPQSEKRTWKADSEDGKRAVAILDSVAKQYKTDPDRTYLTGLSMGGFGTWSLAAAHPDRWAAIAPVCGGVGDRKATPEQVAADVRATAEKIKHIPCWVWHGTADPTVKVEKSRELVAALKAAGGTPRYTELEHVAHQSWDAAYATDDLYAWLFAQKKSKK